MKSVWVRKSVRFSTHFAPQQNFAPDDPSGALLDALAAVCADPPEYLDLDDGTRHSSLLDHLRNYKTRFGLSTDEIPISEFPLQYLGNALSDWIFDMFDEQHPMMPSFALDTATFIDSHASGYYSSEPEPWEIEPWIDPGSKMYGLFRPERQFKKRFTESTDPLFTIVTIPGAGMLECDDQPVILGATQFVFAIHRCHLSERVGEVTHLWPQEEGRPRFDLGHDFKFHGNVLVRGRGSVGYFCPPGQDIASRLVTPENLSNIDGTIEGVSALVPGRWITAALKDFQTYPKKPTQLLPVPCFLPTNKSLQKK